MARVRLANSSPAEGRKEERQSQLVLRRWKVFFVLKWHSFGAPGESGTKWTGGLSFSEYFVWQRGTRPLTRASLNRGAQALLSWPNPSSNMLDRVARTARGGGSAPALCPKLSKAKKERVPIAPTVGVKNTPVSRKASSVTNLREKGAPWCGSVTRTSPRRKEGRERERETDGHGEREREKRMRARGRGVPLVAKGEEDRQKDGERERARLVDSTVTVAFTTFGCPPVISHGDARMHVSSGCHNHAGVTCSGLQGLQAASGLNI